jgi:hypothetical protein
MASLAKRKRAAPTAMCGVALPWEVAPTFRETFRAEDISDVLKIGVYLM